MSPDAETIGDSRGGRGALACELKAAGRTVTPLTTADTSF